MRVVLKKNEEDRILDGSLWVYGNEVLRIDGFTKDGMITDVYSYENRFLGRGYINTNSKILVRLLTRSDEEINRDFYKKRILDANNYRKGLGYDNNYRMIFSDSDFLPGLVVDKYSDILVCQFSTLGMDVIKDMIVDILDELFHPRGIYNRSDLPIRKKEGLSLEKGFLKGNFDTKVEIIENGIKMIVDVENGQKTGYFLDQKENRLSIRQYVKDKVVLDCFSHTGGFALNAAMGNAKEVLAVDISSLAVENIMNNVRLNGFKNVRAEVHDVFKYLRECEQNKITFDTIILDPPAFTKTKDKVQEAYRGYKEINLQAMKIISKNGFLITCSCSENMTPDLFFEMLMDASYDSNRQVRMVDFRIQSKDHPTNLGSSSLYLKYVVLQII